MVERLSPEALRERLEDGSETQILDTRPAAVYEAGHIPGAENLPYAELADRLTEMEWGESVVLVCEEGVSSVQAGRLLESYEGVGEETEIASLDGGYEAWDGALETE